MKVTHCRLSSTWVEAVPELIQKQNTGSLGDLLDRNTYTNLFNSLLAAPSNALVDLPWPRRSGAKYPGQNNYWNDAIVQSLRDHARADAGKLAYNAVVPLRYKPQLASIDRTDRSFVEGWYYPHGVAVSITLWLSGTFDQAGIQQAVSDLLHKPLLTEWPGSNRQALSLSRLAEGCLDRLRQTGFGAVGAGFRPNPMRVLTVIKAEHDAAPDQTAAEEDAMLKALLTSIGGSSDAERKPPLGHIYSFSRGVVIWRPDRFLSTMANLHTLGCLHRNFVLAALQVASLLRAAAVLVAEAVDSGQPVPARLDPYARAVGGLLGRLYGGVGTYSPLCLRDQIGEPNTKSLVSRLRERLDMDPLT